MTTFLFFEGGSGGTGIIIDSETAFGYVLISFEVGMMGTLFFSDVKGFLGYLGDLKRGVYDFLLRYLSSNSCYFLY
jgi:hypothetical protein